MERIAHRTQIYLTKEQHAFLCNQAGKKGVSLAEVIRQLIAEKMPKDEAYEDNRLFAIGKDGLTMGRKNGSLRHDEYLYRGKK
jgi:hypothetical protein